VATEIHRLPPQNIEAEQSILGGVLLDNEAIYKVLENLTEEDFYKPSHQKIFRALIALSEKGEPADLVTLTQQLKEMGTLNEVGGSSYLATLINVVPTAANVPYYSKIVHEKAVLRKLISVASEIIRGGYEDTANLEEFLDMAERSIFDISNRRYKEGFTPIRDIVKSSFKVIEHLYEKKETITGVPSGFDEIDKLTSGWQNSDLIVIAGRPSMGKTSLVLNMAQHSAIEAKIPTAYFSLEMSKEQLVMRMLTSTAKVDSSRLRSGRLFENDWPKLTKAAGQLSEAPIFIDDSPSISVLEIRAKCRRLKVEHQVGLVVIDYLQLMRGQTRSESREKEISEISRGLKGLAKELSVPVIALSQLNRAVENRNDKRPIMADLRECVTGETLVVLKNGQRVPIKELVNSTPEVLAVSPQGKIVSARSDKIWCVGKRPVYKIYLASGRTLRATDKHRLLGATGWIRVMNLAQGDRLALAREIPEPENTVQWSNQRVALLGHLIGDGIPDDNKLREYAANDLFWDQVVEIIPDGEEDVFDLTVPGPACWLADGIVSHNSGAIEQDADIIAFIYRDEAYNKDSDWKGTAEVLISKQRSGPTGMARLAFLQQFTKFENLARGSE